MPRWIAKPKTARRRPDSPSGALEVPANSSMDDDNCSVYSETSTQRMANHNSARQGEGMPWVPAPAAREQPRAMSPRKPDGSFFTTRNSNSPLPAERASAGVVINHSDPKEGHAAAYSAEGSKVAMRRKYEDSFRVTSVSQCLASDGPTTGSSLPNYNTARQRKINDFHCR